MLKSRNEIHRQLENAMTVRDLIEELQTMDLDAVVLIGSDYGDITHTIQALPINGTEELVEGDLGTTAYSRSGLCVCEDGPDDDQFGHDGSQPDFDPNDYFTIALLSV